MLLFLFILFVPLITGAQSNRNINISGTFSGNTLNITEITPATNQKEDHLYLNDDWQPARLYLKAGDSVSLEKVRVDVLHHRLELVQQDILFVLAMSELHSFDMGKKGDAHHFIQADVGNTVMELIYRKDQYAIYRKYDVHIKPPDYNAALNVGSREETRTLTEELYLKTPEKQFALDGNRRKLIQNLDNGKLEEFVKREKLNPSQLSDMYRLVDYAAQL